MEIFYLFILVFYLQYDTILPVRKIIKIYIMKKIIITVIMILGLYHAQAQDLCSKDSVVIDTTMLVENTSQKDKTTEAPPSNLSIKHQFGLGIVAWGQDDLNGRYVKDALSSEDSEQMSDVLNPINNYGFTLADRKSVV